MFVQVLRGRASDVETLHRQLDRWVDELSRGATGWLGTTAGVTDEGEFVAIARFESEQAARANSDRPEQGAWWAETEKCFDGPVGFFDCNDVDVHAGGGSDRAGFVQIMSGRTKDPVKVKEISNRFDEVAPRTRPDLIGSLTAWHGEGAFTEAAYFTSEAEAREGERKPVPTELESVFNEWRESIEGMQFADVRQPWLYSPKT